MEQKTDNPLLKLENSPSRRGDGIELNAQKVDPGMQEAYDPGAQAALSSLMLLPEGFDPAPAEEEPVSENPFDWVKFRIYCPDLQRWYEMSCKDPLITGADIKRKMFHTTGVHPFYARLWFKGNPLRNDVYVRDLPFQNFIEEGDAGLILSVCIAVDDNDEGMECYIEEETPAMKLRAEKPPVYPRVKSLILTDWAVSNLQAKCVLAQRELNDIEAELEATKKSLGETRFHASQCLAKGAMEQNDLIKANAEKREIELENAHDSNKRVVLFFNDLIRYLSLLFFFQLALYLGPNGNTAMFDILSTYQNSFIVSSDQIRTIDDFWNFSELTVPANSYAGHQLSASQLNWTLQMNYLVGDLNLRQMRSQVDKCPIRIEYLDSVNHCYPGYKESLNAAPNAFGPDHQYRYFVDDGGMTSELEGDMGLPYPVDAYSISIPKNSTDAQALLRDMQNNLWVDGQTRAVIASWLVYNPSIDLYIYGSIIYEFPEFGSVIVDQKFESLQPIRYEGTGLLVLLVELIVMMQVIFNVYRELQVITKEFDTSLALYWNFICEHDPCRALDWGNYTLCTVVFCIRMHNVVATQDLYYDESTRKVVGFFDLVAWYRVDVFIQAINCIQMWMKAFKFINIFHTAAIFTEMYGKALADLLQFTYMFFTLNVIFAQAGMMFYGERSIYFITIQNSLYSLFWMLTGKMSAFDLNKISPGAIFYVLYMVIQIFLFLNYVFGVFSFALRTTVYAARPEKYLGFYIRNYIAAEWRQLSEELAWLKFWERTKKRKSKGLLHKENQDAKLNLKPEDLCVTDAEVLCLRDARNHYKKCFGDEELALVMAECDLYKNGMLDKKAVYNFLEKTCSKLAFTDLELMVQGAPLTSWNRIVDPLVFDVIETAQLQSRNTLYSYQFFSDLRHKMRPDTV